MALNPRLARLIDSLTSATTEGRLQWVEGVTDNIYKTKLNEASVSLEFQPLDDSTGYLGSYSLMLKNVEDDVVELEYFDEPNGPDYRRIQSLFEAARKASPSFNAFIDRVIADVDARKG